MTSSALRSDSYSLLRAGCLSNSLQQAWSDSPRFLAQQRTGEAMSYHMSTIALGQILNHAGRRGSKDYLQSVGRGKTSLSTLVCMGSMTAGHVRCCRPVVADHLVHFRLRHAAYLLIPLRGFSWQLLGMSCESSQEELGSHRLSSLALALRVGLFLQLACGKAFFGLLHLGTSGFLL